ncbi:aldo/keto reductase|nr:aldo/keto reductase [Candidatus Pantoea persica]
MRHRYLTSELPVSAIGYGAMGLSEFYGEADDVSRCCCCRS